MSSSGRRSGRETLILRGFVAAAILTAIGAALFLEPSTKASAEIKPLGSAGMLALQLGRFHILALHVPIGVLVATLVAEAATLLRRHRRGADLMVTYLLPLLVATGVAAILLGLTLAHAETYPAKLIARHRNHTLAGITVAGVATLLLPLRARARRWGHRALLGASAGLMMLGAHFGGTITHGADFLFPSAEAKKPNVLPEDTDAGAIDTPDASPAASDASVAVADASVVDAGGNTAAPVPAPVREAGATAPKLSSKQIAQSMFARKCSPCHTRNAKGGLRLTDLSNLKAGEVVPGDPANSKLYTRLTLPLDHDDHMPPQGEAQPSVGEVAAVRRWITDLGAAP